MFFLSVFALPLCTSVDMCLVVPGWEKAEVFALVCSV